MTNSVFVKIENLTRRFPGITALDGVNLTLEQGRVHALVGENGAGKSTLINMMSGVLSPNEGRIIINGVSVSIASPSHARNLGIATVHQHTHLIPELTLAENYALRLGYPRTMLRTIAWGPLRKKATAALSMFKGDFTSSTLAKDLTGVEKQLVEISYGLASEPRLLILDEPTAILPQRETALLFERVKEFAAAGGVVLFVSHRLDEIFEICDDVTVLRDGRFVWQKNIDETNHDDLISGMVGRSVQFERDDSFAPREEVLLRVSNLTDKQHQFNEVSLEVHRGEIYGLYGLVGAGQSELCEALFGLKPAAEGEIVLDKKDLAGEGSRSRVRRGLSYVPADRLSQGVFFQMSVGENMSISNLDLLSRFGTIRSKMEKTENQVIMEQLKVKTQSQDQLIKELSGGNQQKVLLGRWLQRKPDVLILEEPTQGVDVGAKGEIHKIILQLARQGVSILLVSSELPELMTLSHRIGILREGELVKQLDARTATEEEILRYGLPDRQSKSRRTDLQESEKPKGVMGRLLSWMFLQRETSLAMFILLLLVIFGITTPSFATWENLSDILVTNTILLIGALGISFIIIAGGIDISIGLILGLSAVTAGLLDQAGMPPGLIFVCALSTGLLLGALNGTLSVLGKVHPIIITLGTMSVFQALRLQITGGRWILNLSENVTRFGQWSIFGIPVLLYFAAAIVLLSHLFLRHTVAGRKLYAVGGDKESASVLGIYASRLTPLAFGLGGLLMGLAGLLHAGRFGQVQTNAGLGFELKAIAAAVIGGTHIMGGRGSTLGTVFGALLMGIIMNLLVLTKISVYWENVVVGGMIFLAVTVDMLISERRSK